ncbi:PH domain-containing protein [Agilicoccus flavus]|uniref:PH domain-containing protein n=1 Tax=Agilicoccus flavus TaxID=2775968 RepID=UPI001CF69A96|nr:PH domain-containing protein [Agilicoccus flavus]
MPERNTDQLERYLLKGERIVVAVHRHWGAVAEPMVTTSLALVAVIWFAVGADEALTEVATFAWCAWVVLLGRALWMLIEWRREWFIATDRRLLLVYGFIVRKVDMMPLGKVTDMTYHRSIPGRLLGYGTFVLESAGTDQALSRIGFVPHPDQTYRAMIGQIFHREGDDDVDEGTEYSEYEAEVEQEPDPARRASLRQRFMRFTGLAPGEAIDEGDVQVSEQSRRRSEEEHENPDRHGRHDRRDHDDPHDHDPRDREQHEWRDRDHRDRNEHREHEDEGTSLFAAHPGESLYRGGTPAPREPGDGTADSPVTDFRDDTTGWWNRP